MFADAHIWVPNSADGSVTKINPTTGAVVDTITGVGTLPFSLVFDGTSIWAANRGGNTIVEIDPTTGVVGTPIPVAAGPYRMAYDGTDIWITNVDAIRVTRFNPTTEAITEIAVGVGPSGVVVAAGSIWVANQTGDSVSRIDPNIGTVVATVTGIDGAHALATDGTYVWVAANGPPAAADTVWRIDPDTNTAAGPLAILPAAGDKAPRSIAYDGQSMWIANVLGDSLSRVPAATALTPGGAISTVASVDGAWGIVFDGTYLWVTSSVGNTITRTAPF